MKNDNDAITPSGARTAENSNIDLRKIADPTPPDDGSWRGVIRRVVKTTPRHYEFGDTASNPKVLPLLPYSPAASKLVARASPVDPRYVDLEQAPVETKSKPPRSRLPSSTSLGVIIFACLFGGFAVALLSNHASPDHTVRAKPVNADKLPPGTQIQSIAGRAAPVSQPIQAIQNEPATASAQIDNDAHLSSSSSDHHVPMAKTAAPNAREVEISTLTPSSTNHADPATIDPPITHPSQSSEQITTLPPSEKSPTTATIEPVMPSKPVPTRAIETLSMSEILKLGQQLLKSGDVTAARKLFRYAANKGLAQGALAMGTTYDAKTLLSLGLATDSASVKRALHWYRRAHVLGDANPQHQPPDHPTYR